MKTMLLLALLFPLMCNAQVRKCTGPDGKIVYSDFICSTGTVKEVTVRTDVNNLDHSGLRKEGRRIQETEELADLTANTPNECRFKYYIGDLRGKAMAAKAKAECIKNLVAVKQGTPTGTEAYSQWKEGYDQTGIDRRAAVARASATNNANMITNSNQRAMEELGRKIDRPTTCTQNTFSVTPSLTCK